MKKIYFLFLILMIAATGAEAALSGQGNAVIVGAVPVGNCLKSGGGVLLKDAGISCGGGTGSFQTPWLQNIDGGTFNLTNVGSIIPVANTSNLGASDTNWSNVFTGTIYTDGIQSFSGFGINVNSALDMEAAIDMGGNTLYMGGGNLSFGGLGGEITDGIRTVIDPVARLAYYSGNVATLDWEDVVLFDKFNQKSVSWGDRQLLNVFGDGSIAVDYTGTPSTSAGISFDTNKNVLFGGAIIDTSNLTTIDPRNRQLIGADGSTAMLDWSDGTETNLNLVNRGLTNVASVRGTGFGNLILDPAGQAVEVFGSLYIPFGGITTDIGMSTMVPILDANNQQLIANDGSTVAADWSGNFGRGFSIPGTIYMFGLPSGTLLSPPSVDSGEAWLDTTTSATDPILRVHQ